MTCHSIIGTDRSYLIIINFFIHFFLLTDLRRSKYELFLNQKFLESQLINPSKAAGAERGKNKKLKLQERQYERIIGGQELEDNSTWTWLVSLSQVNNN